MIAGSRACPGSAATSASAGERLAAPRGFAIDYFVYRIALAAGVLVAALGGIDAFVFTAGIGENAPAIRAAVIAAPRMARACELEDDANAAAASRISTPKSRVACFIVPTDEEAMIARHTVDTLDEHGLVTALGVAQ